MASTHCPVINLTLHVHTIEFVRASCRMWFSAAIFCIRPKTLPTQATHEVLHTVNTFHVPQSYCDCKITSICPTSHKRDKGTILLAPDLHCCLTVLWLSVPGVGVWLRGPPTVKLDLGSRPISYRLTLLLPCVELLSQLFVLRLLLHMQ